VKRAISSLPSPLIGWIIQLKNLIQVLTFFHLPCSVEIMVLSVDEKGDLNPDGLFIDFFEPIRSSPLSGQTYKRFIACGGGAGRGVHPPPERGGLHNASFPMIAR
jgi:hypothetical protein